MNKYTMVYQNNQHIKKYNIHLLSDSVTKPQLWAHLSYIK